MPTFMTTCRTCGREFEPDHTAIVAGTWRICPVCRSPLASEQLEAPSHCEGCGRVLRAGTRTLCYSCLTGATGL